MESIKRVVAWFRTPHKSGFVQQLKTFFLVIVPIAFVIRTYFYGLYQVPTGSMEVTMLVGDRFFADKLTVLFRPPQRGDIITFNDPNFPYSQNYFMRLYQRYVWGPSNWTKRVIATPGDHVKGVIENGKPVVYLNGKKLDEPYINRNPLIALFKDDPQCPYEFRSWDRNVPFDKQPFYKMDGILVNRGARLMRQFGESAVREPFTPVVAHGKNVDEFDVVLKSDEYWAMGDNRQGSFDSRYWGPLKAELIHGKIIWRIFSIDSHDSWLIFDMLQHPIEFWSRVRWSRFFQRVR